MCSLSLSLSLFLSLCVCLSLSLSLSAIEIAIQPALLFKAPFLVAAAADRGTEFVSIRAGSGQRRKGWPKYFATSSTRAMFHSLAAVLRSPMKKLRGFRRALIAVVGLSNVSKD